MWAERALRKALRAAEQAEVLETSKSFLRVLIENDKVTYVESGSTGSLRVMVIKDKKIGLSRIDGLTETRVLKAVETALDSMRASKPDPDFEKLVGPKPLPAASQIFDGKIRDMGIEDLLDRVLEGVDAAEERGSVIVQGEVTLTVVRNRLINSEGVDVEYDKTGAGFSICLAVYEGEVGSEGFRSRSTVYWDDLKLLENIAEVSELTSKTLRPEKIEPGVYTVVLAPDAAYSILSLIGFAVNADNVRKKRSPWTGRIGQRVASEKLTVIDDALLPRGRETAPCDGEGYPMRRKTVIEKGVLKTYLYDYYTARLMGTESTGNASSERPPPSISTTNVIVEPGSRTPEELIGEVERGVYIPRLPPLLANPVTGDFSAELRQAFTIEGGELGKPVRWGMLAGSVYHMLERITEVASDQTMIGTYLVPTVMVENVRIAG